MIHLSLWSEWRAANVALLAIVESWRAGLVGSRLGVQAGEAAWASPHTLLAQCKGFWVRRLEAWVRDELAAFGWRGRHLEAWATWQGPGGSCGWHDHHQAEVSAVYYVAAAEGAGRLRVALAGVEDAECGVPLPPVPGLLAVFSARTTHCVEASAAAPGGTARISIVFNGFAPGSRGTVRGCACCEAMTQAEEAETDSTPRARSGIAALVVDTGKNGTREKVSPEGGR